MAPTLTQDTGVFSESPDSPPPPTGAAPAAVVELCLAVILLAVVGLGALYLILHPGRTVLDLWGWSFVRHHYHSGLLDRITWLGSPYVLALGALSAGAVMYRVNRLRAAAMVVGPLLAVLASEGLKPLVGRTFQGVLTYPSGTVTAVTALVAVGVLATRGLWRWAAFGIGSVVVGLIGVSVVALGWHFPTDAMAGAALGAGGVLLVDACACFATTAFPAWARPPGQRTTPTR
ncbi:MAG TPA: hypothetical protein VN768_06350 [Acidimicrobiales bacterium]|nr:hypothetical protein [Acidimicrobiales bacterium]